MKIAESFALVLACVAAIGFGASAASRSSSTTGQAPPPPVAAWAPRVEATTSRLDTPFLFGLGISSEAWGAKARRDVDELRDAFLGTARLDDLFERGLRSPASGGLFYARQALRHCTMLRNAVGSDRIDRARQRCGSLGDPASRERLDATLQTATVRLDPALAIVEALDTRSRDSRLAPADIGKAFDAAVALGDPYVLRTVLLRGVPRIERFDGRPVDAELRSDLMMASRLALCDLGVDCAQEARVLLTCASNDRCADPLTAMGVGGASMSDDRRRHLADLATRLTVAARDGSLSGLVQ